MAISCRVCRKAFEDAPEDIALRSDVAPVLGGKKYDIPPPTLCPDCRALRRMSWRNERTLYKRTCNATQKSIVSVYSQDKPFIVYENKAWYAGTWDGHDQGRDIDFTRPFFPQFAELLRAVPHLALSAIGTQNSDYVNQCGWCKNCYLLFEADVDQDCMYGNFLYDSKSCVDMLQGKECELCYECIDCRKCYSLAHSQDCENCSSSWFLKNCIGCMDCIACSNVRNKKHCIWNKQYSEAEYKKMRDDLHLTSSAAIAKLGEQFSAWIQQFPQRAMHGTQNEDSSGDYLWNTQRCVHCFDLLDSQDCKYVASARNMKKVHDTLVFGAEKGAEFCYENHEVGEGVRGVAFCDQLWTSVSNVYYSKLCMENSHDLFGCMGLRHASYCILNKQYTKEEYERLAGKLIEHMRSTNEWGEYFSMEMSPFAYNETVAQEYFPLSEEDVKSRSWKWRDEEGERIPASQSPSPIPEAIDRTSDDILKSVLRCERCAKAYKIIPQELSFYRQMNVAVPRECFDCRHLARMALRNPRKLWNRNCAKCQRDIETSYAPGRPETVYCESCYLSAIY
ncbi:MAG: hypothetical protein Q7R81_05795 [Candidatus Peregrinibacteria bacterium]|nr:hypothetical protein [Candidatus Peregrinibacteria bacterium]